MREAFYRWFTLRLIMRTQRKPAQRHYTPKRWVLVSAPGFTLSLVHITGNETVVTETLTWVTLGELIEERKAKPRHHVLRSTGAVVSGSKPVFLPERGNCWLLSLAVG